MRTVFVLLIYVFIGLNAFANSIEGLILDEKTSEYLAGATVYIKGRETEATTSNLDGRFILNNVPTGKVLLVCSSISYETKMLEINVPKSDVLKLTLKMISIVNELKGVTITSTSLTTDATAHRIEKLSARVMNVVGAKSIESSPDITVAEVLSRVSGVTLEKNSSGEPEYAVLRGMDKRYNITLVNGVKISSPNNKQRFVPLNIFPSELLDRLEVSKNRSAEMEGDATGGTVNMLMKDASSNFSLSANVAMGYSTLLIDRDFETFDKSKTIKVSPYEKYGKDYSANISDFNGSMNSPETSKFTPNIVAGLNLSNRLFDEKLGMIFAFNFQNLNKGTNTTYFEDQMIQTESVQRLTGMNERIYSDKQMQYGAHLKFDYVFSSKHKLEWYNFLVKNDNTQVRQSTSTNFKLNYDPPVGNLDLGYQTRMRTTNQHIFASTLHGKHWLFNNFGLNWTAVYSKAGLQRPDLTYVNVDNLVQSYIDHIQIDGDGSERRWEHNSDQDLSLLADMEYLHTQGANVWKIQSGGLIRRKDRDNNYVKYTFKPVNLNQSFNSIDEIEWTVYTPKGSVGPLSYSAKEFTGAGYFQIIRETKSWQQIVGIRAEFTDQGYHMFYPNSGEPADGNQKYLDLLPNVQLKFIPNHNTNWRFSYFRSVNRPGYFEVVPYQIQEEEYTEYGNKNLKRTIIDNVDMRWEWFPKPMDQFMVGIFLKRIESPIEYAYFSVNQRQSGYGLQNLGNAQNLGIEIDAIKFVGLFGVKANYTYTKSSITTAKVYYSKDEYGNTKTLSADQTRPLVNQAAHVANFSLIYKDVENGWDGQLSSTYTGDKIVIASRFLNSDYWEKGGINLDLSFEKKFNSGWSVFLKANNILNTPSVFFLKTHNTYNDNFPFQSASSGETIINKSYYKPTLLTGIRFKFNSKK